MEIPRELDCWKRSPPVGRRKRWSTRIVAKMTPPRTIKRTPFRFDIITLCSQQGRIVVFNFPAGNDSSGDWVVSGWKGAGHCGAVAADVSRRISWLRRDWRRLTSAATTTLEKPKSSPPGVARLRAAVFIGKT